MRLLYYDITHLLKEHQDLPGLGAFTCYFKLFGQLVAPVDRTGTIKFPVQTTSIFPLPQMRFLTKTYEELCDERAYDLLVRADVLDVPMCVFWSGGVDSTCLLVALLKNSTPAQRERIVVVMSEESIREYPEFYAKHIRGKLRCESGLLFPYLLGTRKLLVNGEHNDQLFGSDVVVQLVNRFSFDVVHKPYDRSLFVTFFTEKMEGNETEAWRYVRLFEDVCRMSPVRLVSNFDVFWWVNFTLKWQTVYMRVLSFVSERTKVFLTKDYIEHYYQPFFNTEAFQLWSMNNLRQRVADSWRSYKWVAKKVIYDFTKDLDYYTLKQKRGSLQYLLMQHTPYNFIDEDYGFHYTASTKSFYEEDSDFTTRIRLRA
jgi:hypothetical protein